MRRDREDGRDGRTVAHVPTFPYSFRARTHATQWPRGLTPGC
ncbi:MAG: hypothetical protein AVDCRST_MAG85-4362 [uncultured Solirubrobacteraceae bacterium]|uniref:Uncharacterized protein n=1 Tax=uncultured Solirubrobacteraceae bacterium TaxID=1162706 RepID=A0A6J4U1P8_9ACTN|nr:MAG: hypothetical protein AVDCRST_MAG85-4362 [uncultured Solirubrobacteraceae bacterium]